jgi:eukaryotic-like serine/threonine-protein kinase
MQHIQDPPVQPRQYNAAIPPALEEIILKCLEKTPEMRYRDGSQLARALETLGDEDAIATLPLTPGSTAVPPVSTTFNQIPSRPNSSGRSSVRSGALTPRVPVSSPNHMMPTGVSPDGMNGKGPVAFPQAQPPQPLYIDQNAYLPPVSPSGSETTRPFRREGEMDDGKQSRAATIITIFILLATLLLLIFSIYLADRLGFIHLPFLNTGGVTPTVTVVSATVPDLRKDDYARALQVATGDGFQLRVSNYPGTPPVSYIVTDQSPLPGRTATKGTIIEVMMHAPMTTVPVIPADTSLVVAEQLLQQAGLNAEPLNAGPNNTLGPNTVVSISPSAGSSVAVNSTVTLYVANYISGSPGVSTTPTTTPTPTKTPDPTASPTTPTPTASPTTPTPTPTKTPDPTPTPSSTP